MLHEWPHITIVRSRRKTLALVVATDATVTVRAPFRASESVITAFIRRHNEWIVRAVERARRKRPAPPKRFIEGEAFPFFGVSYPLSIVLTSRRALAFSPARGFTLRERDRARARALFESWYRESARAYMTACVERLSKKHGIAYRSIKITGARRRWGSCSSAATLNFSWRVVLAPAQVADYVAAHELSHARHMNHSERFWRLVGELCPTYKKARAWLGAHGHALVI